LRSPQHPKEGSRFGETGGVDWLSNPELLLLSCFRGLANPVPGGKEANAGMTEKLLSKNEQ
jgi:hypothetical protein